MIAMPKNYYWTNEGTGRGSRYIVNFHDGVKKYNDGSDFYDIRIFKNRKSMDSFINELRSKKYHEGVSPLYAPEKKKPVYIPEPFGLPPELQPTGKFRYTGKYAKRLGYDKKRKRKTKGSSQASWG